MEAGIREEGRAGSIIHELYRNSGHRDHLLLPSYPRLQLKSDDLGDRKINFSYI